MASLCEITGLSLQQLLANTDKWLDKAVMLQQSIMDNIYTSRAKDYQNEFRKMMYASTEEMEKVTGSLDENSFISEQQQLLEAFKKRVNNIKHSMKSVQV